MSTKPGTQTEGSNLAVVEETVFGSKTPPATGAINLQPNSYGTFGAQFKKLPRDPISRNQQLLKSMLVDEDSTISVEFDVTRHHVNMFAPGIYRCRAWHNGNKAKSRYPVSEVTSTGYTVDSLGDLTQRMLIMARGFGTANDGLKMVGAASTDTETKVTGLTVQSSSDTPDNAEIEVAGWRGATGDIFLDSNGDLNSTAGVFTSWNLKQFQWIYIGGEDDDNRFATEDFFGPARVRTITATKLTLDRRSWLVEAQAFLNLATLTTNFDTVVQAVAAGAGGNSITVAAVADGTQAVKAELDLGPLLANVDTVIRAKTAGADGNLITVEIVGGAGAAAGVLTEVGTHVKLQVKITATATTVAQLEALIGTSTLIEVKTADPTGATSLDAGDLLVSTALAGGADGDAPSVSEVGSAVTLHYTPSETTVAEMEAAIAADATLIEVKTPGTGSNVLLVTADDFGATALAGGNSGADDGAGKNIDVYFSRFYRVVPQGHDDYLVPSYAFEEEFFDIGPDGEPMYQYQLGKCLDEWVWNIPLANKSTANVTFIGTRTLKLTTTRKAGFANALDANSNAGISTTTDLQRLRMDDADELGISTDFTSLKVTEKNNVSAQKQLAHQGATRMNHGKHTSMIEAELVFTDSTVIDGVRDNRDCTLDTLMRNEDFGALIDVQAMTLDTSDLKMEKDKLIMVTSKASGFMHPISGSTGSLTVFAFLPPVDTDDQE